MCMTGLPVPVVPSPNIQVKVYGGTPPEATMLQVTGVPAMAVPQVTVAVMGCEVMTTDAEAGVLVAASTSVAVTVIT